MDWAGRLDAFLNDGGLHLRCQQVMPIGVARPCCPITRFCWASKRDGLEISPTHFIPQSSAAACHEVDIWVMRRVFEWIGANQSNFASVGVSPSIFPPPRSAIRGDALSAKGVAGQRLPTTRSSSRSPKALPSKVMAPRRISSGSSPPWLQILAGRFRQRLHSYAHLKNLRTDTLKIDGSFVKDMLQNPRLRHGQVDERYRPFAGPAHRGRVRGIPMLLDALREIGVDYARAMPSTSPVDSTNSWWYRRFRRGGWPVKNAACSGVLTTGAVIKWSGASKESKCSVAHSR